MLTGDTYKETYIESLSQLPPNNGTFLKGSSIVYQSKK